MKKRNTTLSYRVGKKVAYGIGFVTGAGMGSFYGVDAAGGGNIASFAYDLLVGDNKYERDMDSITGSVSRTIGSAPGRQVPVNAPRRVEFYHPDYNKHFY